MKNTVKKANLFSLFVLLASILLSGATAFAQNDAAGSKDPSLFTRMPGYHIYRYDDLQFDQYEFKISSEKTKVVEGHSLFIIYDLNDNIQAPSPLQIGRNYINAARSVGGQLVYEFHDPGEDVVGHTDNVGTLESNMKLSQDRAAAVVNALTGSYGISSARLKACGDGPTAPVTSNDAEAGRALNRRVELVKQ